MVNKTYVESVKLEKTLDFEMRFWLLSPEKLVLVCCLLLGRGGIN